MNKHKVKKTNFFLFKQSIKCLNKTVYSSRYVAEEEAKKYSLRAYKCVHCNKFHLTSKLI
jgi:hypothetical protein